MFSSITLKCVTAQKTKSFRLKKDYEDDFKTALLRARGVIKKIKKLIEQSRFRCRFFNHRF